MFHKTENQFPNYSLQIEKIQIKSLCKYVLSQLGNRHKQYLGKHSLFSPKYEYTICRYCSWIIYSIYLPYRVSPVRVNNI